MAIAQMRPTETVIPGNLEIRRMLARRAQRRGRSSLKWNTSTLMFAYSVMAATILVATRVQNDLLIALTAILGLVAVAAFSSFQAKRLEATFLDEEVKDYIEILSAGAPSPPANVADAAVTQSDLSITQRELEVLRQIAAGKSNKEAANALSISEQTVKNHLRHIFEKIDVTDRTSAILFALRNGWITFNSANG